MFCWLTSHLYRVQAAVSVEREAGHVCRVLVPAGVHRVAHDVSGFGEDLLDQNFLSAEGDPLTQIRRDPDHQNLAGHSCPPGLLLRLPALQLPHHWGQLVEPGLLVQLGKVLREGSEVKSQSWTLRSPDHFRT